MRHSQKTKKLVYAVAAMLVVIGVVKIFSVSMLAARPAEAPVGTQSAQTVSSTKDLSSRDEGSDRTGPCTPLGGTKCGKVVIRKDANPDSYQDFYFVHTIPGYVSPFMLDDDGTLPGASTALSYVRTFYTPENGAFSVSEQIIPQVYNPVTDQYEGGYNVSIACIDPSGGTTTAAATANISMFNAETVTCTFKNTPMAPTPVGPQACLPNTWTQRANFGGAARSGATSFSIGTKGYISTGYSGIYGDQQDLWEYDQINNTWTQKANFTGGVRVKATGLSIGTKGYLGLGYHTSYHEDFFEYNPSTNIWTQKADFGGVPRYLSIGFSIGTKGYMGTGWNGTAAVSDFWEYNPATNIWTQKANFGGGVRQRAVGFSIGSKGYVGLGMNSAGNLFQDLWEYNPASNTWTQKANFSAGTRQLASSFSIGSKGYVGTGYDGDGNMMQDFWEYNPSTNTWTQKTNYGGGPIAAATGLSIGSKGYIGTGDGGQPQWNPMANDWEYTHKDFWEYCP